MKLKETYKIDNMRKAYFFTLLFLAVTGNLFGQFAGGTGTLSNPYQIATAEHLDNIRTILAPGSQFYFIQTADIDLSGYANWEPIGGNGTELVFNGFYNGQHYTISNLTINRPSTDNVGLFGHYASGDVNFGQFTRIENIVLENANVTGNNAVGALVGRVTGSQRNVIRDCFVITGTVTGNSGVGGLAGVNSSFLESVEGQEGERPIIRRSYSNVEVVASGGSSSERIGGLVGCNSRGQIENSHSAGTISASSASKVGGLVGCSEELAVISNSFSTGFVDATGSEVGGLVGSLGSGTVTASYWDTETSGQTSSAGGTGRITAQMQNQTTFSGWDFSSVWNIFEGEYYPFLRNHNLSGFDLTDPGQLDAGQSFDLEITNAFDVGSYILDGEYQVTVTSNIETEGSSGLLLEGEISFLNGIAEISGLVLNTAGEHTITVTIATILNEEQILVDVAAGPAVKLLILQQPAVVTGNNDDLPALIPSIVVASVDVFDNVTSIGLDENQEVSVTLHVDGSAEEDAILGNDDNIILQNGLASFNNLTLDKEGTGFVLRFTSTGNSGKTDLGFVDTDPFDVTNIVDLSGFIVEEPVDDETKLLQDPFDVIIANATDVTGVSIAGNSNVQLSSSLEGLIFNQDVSFISGGATFSVALEQAGLHDLTITVEGVTQSVTVVNINATNDLSGFSLDLDPVSGPYYQAIPFTLKIIGAKGVTNNFIEEAAITVSSNIEGVVFDEEAVLFPSPGEIDLEIVLFVISAPGNHILTVEIEGVTNPQTIELMIQENNSGFEVELEDPEIDIVAGAGFDVRIFDAFNVTTPILAFTGNYNVEIISNLEGEVFNSIASFNNGQAYITLSLEIAGIHDLSISVETIVGEEVLEDIEVEPAEAEALVIVSGVVPDVSGNNDGQPVKISDITLQTQDKFGNRSTKELNASQTVSVSIHGDSEGSGTFTGGSTLNVDISSGEATFDDLFITDEGLYKLEFSSTWDETEKTAETNFFTVSDINNQAGFDIVDPGPLLINLPFELVLINAKDITGSLLNGNYNVIVTSPPFPLFNNAITFSDGQGEVLLNGLSIAGTYQFNVEITALSVQETIFLTFVSDDDSEFTITPPGNQLAGVPFNMGITNAKDKAGNDLDGRKHLVTVTSDNTNEGTGGLLLNDSIQFTGGSALVEDLTLFVAEEQNLTVTIDWITDPVSQAVVVEPNTATQFVFVQQPTGFANGEYEGIPRPVGTVVLQTLDDYDNLSMVGFTAPLTVTAAINSGPAEAELGGDLELNLTDGEVTFDDLTLDKNGTYTLSFTFNGIADPAFEPNPLISDEFDMVNIEDFSEFTVLDPGDQYENIPFVLQLVNATDKFGNPLNGEFNLILESDQTAEGVDGEIYNVEFTFVDGELDLPLTLITVAIHELTITLDGLNSNNIAVINVEVLPDLSAFELEIAPDPLVIPVYQNNPFDLVIFNALDLDGLELDGEFLVSITSDVAGEEEIFEGQVNFVSGLASVSLSLPTITTYILTVEVEGITESQDISVDVVFNPSGFSAELADPSDKVAGVDFDINITNAIGLDGNLLGETSQELHRVVITSNLSGVEFDADVLFDEGEAVVTLNIELAAPLHLLTIAVTGITPTEELSVTVIPAEVSQLILTVDNPPLGGTGTGNDTPTEIGTIIIRTADQFGNISTEGLTGTQVVTAEIFTDGSVGQNAQLGGDLTKNIVSGAATFDDLTLDKDGVGYVLEFVYSGTPDLELGSVFTDPFDMMDVNLYQISLRDSENEELDTEINPLVFDTAIEGYAPVDEEIITILRLGAGDITGIFVELDTEGANHFTITQPLADEITGSETSTTFTLEPNTGLSAGVYEAVVTVTANNDITEEFAVFFTVLAPFAITITDEEDQLIGPGNPLFFESVDEVYTPETRTLTVTNTGGNILEDLIVISEDPTDFIFGPLSSTTLLPGQSATFTITPEAELDPDFYSESVIVRDLAENVSVEFDIQFEVLEFTYSVEIDPSGDVLTLPALPVGYLDPSAAALEITIIRTGTGPINNIEVELLSDVDFELLGLPLGDLDGDPDNELSFTIQPLIGLPLGFYFDLITISADNIDDIEILIEFEVVGEIVWTGAVSTAWQNSGNWDQGVVPTSDEFVVIPDVSSGSGNAPVINNAVTVRGLLMEENSSLTINSGGPRLSIRSGGNLIIENNAEIFASGGLRILGNAVMTMEPGSRVTVLGTMVNENGTQGVIMKSDATNSASLIHNSSGIQATVERFIPGEAPNQFHAITTPVAGQSFSSFFADNQGVIAFNPGPGIYAMQEYIEVGGWSAFFPANKPGNLIPGTAYSVGLPQAGTLTFKGTLRHNNLSKNITRELFGWNGFGNPFASSMDLEQFLIANVSNLDPQFAALYVFDPNLSGGPINYHIVNLANAESLNLLQISYGQGFIVKAKEGGGTITANTGMRTHANPQFYKDQPAEIWYHLMLNVSDIYSNQMNTYVAFNENMSTGLDVLYDAGMFSADQAFKLFTRMPENESELNLGVQALPVQGMKNVYIPVGFSYPQGGEVVFSLQNHSLPIHFTPMLFDSEMEIFTDLSLEVYIAEIEPGSEATGRFYLKMESLSYYSVSFGAANEGGDVSATADEADIESGTELPEGTLVQFFAYPFDGYEIDQWIVDGVILEDVTANELIFDDLHGDLDVQVSFKETSTHVEEDFADDNLIIYIFENRIVINGPIRENTQAVLYDMLGRQMRVEQLQLGPYNEIIIDDLKPGGYFIHILNNELQTIRKLLIN
jgi:hypothetical protein